jgi:hypothetical protein
MKLLSLFHLFYTRYLENHSVVLKFQLYSIFRIKDSDIMDVPFNENIH